MLYRVASGLAEREVRADLAPGLERGFGIGTREVVHGRGVKGAGAVPRRTDASGHVGDGSVVAAQAIECLDAGLPLGPQQAVEIIDQATFAVLPGECQACPDVAVVDGAAFAQGVEQPVTGAGLRAADPPQGASALCGFVGGAVEQGRVVIALAYGPPGLAVADGQQVGEAPVTTEGNLRLSPHPAGKGRVGVPRNIALHLFGRDVREARFEAMIFHIAGEHVVVDGNALDARPLMVACGIEGAFHGPVFGR